MRKKILITGASGFVGSHLTQLAQELGLEVHAAVRSSSKTDDIKAFVDRLVQPNFEDINALRELFQTEQYHYIIHAAALTKAKSEARMREVNVGYTRNIAEAAFSAAMPLQRLVYVSSLAAIGPVGYNEDPIVEENPHHPVTVYGRSKQASEAMLQEKFADKPISVFRPTAVYGPRERDLFIVFDTMKRGLDPYIGRKPQKLSFIYVKDLAALLLKSCIEEQGALQFYNVTDGQVYSRYHIAEVVGDVLKRKMWRFHVPYGVVKLAADVAGFLYRRSTKTPVIYPERLHELTAENWACDISKLKDALGYVPKYGLEEGLKETLAWYKVNKWL